MKKFLSLILTFIMLCSVAVFPCSATANEPELIIEERPEFPKCSPKPEIMLFSLRSDPVKEIESTLLETWDDVSTKYLNFLSYDLTPEEFRNIYYDVLFGHPEYFYVETYGYNLLDGKINIVQMVYNETDKSVISQTLDLIGEASDEILMSIDDDMTDFEKVMAVHNHMIAEYEYDYSLSNFTVTIMVTKTGVCQAYSMAFKHLMNQLGIDCIYVTSDSMQHGWNLVKIDGNWYHIDLTWDDKGDGSPTGGTNEYALLSDSSIQDGTQHPGAHLNYDSAGLSADHTDYDDVDWRHSESEVVAINHILYYVKDNDIVTDKGNVIFENLDNGDGYWNISDLFGFKGAIYANLEERNGLLYFNTENKVYEYNPTTNVKKVVWGDSKKVYIGGFNINMNKMTLFELSPDFISGTSKIPYNKYETVILEGPRVGKPVFVGETVKTYIYKEDHTPITVFCRDADGTITSKQIINKGMNKVYFDRKNRDQTYFYWIGTSSATSMRPIKNKEIVRAK